MQIACPHCAKLNRVPEDRLGDGPRCGECKQLLITGEPVELNPWIRANHRVANEVVSVLTGQLSAAAGQAAGLFDMPRARAMEQLFLPLWQAAGATTHTDTAPVAAGLAWQVKG